MKLDWTNLDTSQPKGPSLPQQAEETKEESDREESEEEPPQKTWEPNQR